MRISDWSSDVCSSDLLPGLAGLAADAHLRGGQRVEAPVTDRLTAALAGLPGARLVASASSLDRLEHVHLLADRRPDGGGRAEHAPGVLSPLHHHAPHCVPVGSHAVYRAQEVLDTAHD